MRSVWAFSLIAFLTNSAFADVGEKVPTHMSVSANIAAIVIGGFEIQYEYELAPFFRLSLPLEIKILDLTLLPQRAVSGSRIYAFGFFPNFAVSLGVGGKFITSGGWYAEPAVEIGYAQIIYPIENGTTNLAMLQPKITFGYQTISDFGLLINVGLGVGGRYFFPESGAVPLVFPVAVVSVGYAW